ncbi:hypothetical protein FBU30_010962 [Linnemannia zychae]|nr:hypothetical protein FBU30_010962 [Linnemannia zychae]
MDTSNKSKTKALLSWIPKRWLKLTLACLIIFLILIISMANVEVEYNTWRNRLDLEIDNVHMITGKSSSLSKSDTTKYGIYMYIGCSASPLAAAFWHFTQAVKVCDPSNPDRMCDVKVKKDYSYEKLGLKSQEWLQSNRFSQMLDENEVIVKLDDDTIITKDVLNGMVEDFARSDCKMAGAVRQTDFGRYWISGPFLMVKADYLKKRLHENWDFLPYTEKSEDMQMAALLDIYESEDVCNVDINAFRHRYYEDSRMVIRANFDTDHFEFDRKCDQASWITDTRTSTNNSGFGYNLIREKGFQALSGALMFNSVLTALNVRENVTREKEAQGLLEALLTNSTLSNLDLKRCIIKDARAQALSKVFKSNPSLKNSIRENGVQALSKALMVNLTLVVLTLRNNSIRDYGAQALSEVLKLNMVLYDLSLENISIRVDGALAFSGALMVNSTLSSFVSQ